MVYPASHLSQENVLRDVHDPVEQRLRVDSQVTAIVEDVTVNVNLDAATDSIAIKDPGTGNSLEINSDGSINVISDITGTVKNKYNEVTSVASSIDTLIVSHTMTVDGDLLCINVSGENIATYEIKINGVVQDKLRTYFGGNLNAVSNFEIGAGKGLPISNGDTIQVRVIHTRPSTANFNARIQYKEN